MKWPATIRWPCTNRSPRRSTGAYDRIRSHPGGCAHNGAANISERPRWPAIVLRTPKGWTGPADRRRQSRRGHLPLAPGPVAARRGRTPTSWRCSRVAPQLSTRDAVRRIGTLASTISPTSRRDGERAHGREPARERRPPAAAARRSGLPRVRRRRSHTSDRRARIHTPTRRNASRHIRSQRRAQNFRLFCPDETNSNRLSSVFDVENRCLDRPTNVDRRPRRARRPRHGGAERTPVRGLARGLFAHGPPRNVRDVRVIRDGLRLDDRAALQMARRGGGVAVARSGSVAQHPAHVHLLAKRSQRLQPPGARTHRRDAVEARHGRRGSISRRTPTRCSRSPTTVCARATTSTSS